MKKKPLALTTSKTNASAARTRLGLWKPKFLEALTNTPSVTAAARFAGVDRQTAYTHKEKDPAFAEAWADALQQSLDRLEHQAWKFAITLENADPHTMSARARMAEFMLKAHRPAVYRERTEVGVVGGVIVLPAKREDGE